MDSEFKQFIDTLKRLGIVFSLRYNLTLTRDEWQKIIVEAGYNITALACTVVEVGDMEALFSNKPILWRDEKSCGPDGLFVLSRNKRTNEVQNRVYYDKGERCEGVAAVMATYPREHWNSFKDVGR